LTGEDASGFPFPLDLQVKLRGTPWMDGDPYYRVILACSGYINTLLACWYNTKVDVVVLRDHLSDVTPIEGDFEWAHLQQFERKMQIQTDRGIVCVCTCRTILRHRQDVADDIRSRRVDIGQLFQHFSILPRFRLVDAGAEASQAGGGVCLWREYTLRGQGIECRIREDFRPDFLGMQEAGPGADGPAPSPKRCRSVPHPMTVNFGNLVLGEESHRVLEQVRGARHPLERALLAAEGNVVRVLASYYLCDTSLHVHSVTRRADEANTFERSVFISCRGVIVGRARSSVRIEGEQVLAEVEKGLSTAPGALFHHTNCLPKFTLIKIAFADSPRPGFGRHYKWAGSGISCDIREEYAQAVLDLDTASLEGVPELF